MGEHLLVSSSGIIADGANVALGGLVCVDRIVLSMVAKALVADSACHTRIGMALVKRESRRERNKGTGGQRQCVHRPLAVFTELH